MAAKAGLKQQCPHCDALVPIKNESQVGKRMKCPKCGESFLVEDPEEAKPAKGPKAAKGAATDKAAAKTRPGARRQRDDDDDDDGRPRFKKKTQGNSTLILCLGLGAAAVLLLGAGAYVLFFNTSDTPKQASSPPPGTKPGANTPPATGQTPKTEAVTLTAATPVAGNPISNMLPPDTQSVINFSMTDILANNLGNMALNHPTFSQAIGFPVDSIEQLIMAEGGKPEWTFVILRTKSSNPISMEAVQHAMRLQSAKETAPFGQDYFLTSFGWSDLVSSITPPQFKGFLPPSTPLAVRLHDPHTLVLADLPIMKVFLQAQGKFPYQTVNSGKDASASESKPAVAGLPGTRRPAGSGGQRPSAAPAVVSSALYRTINPRLKSMLDTMEANKPFLVSMAADFGSALQATPMPIPLPDLDTIKVVGLSYHDKGKRVVMAGVECDTEQNATKHKQTLDQMLTQSEAQARAMGIKLEKGGSTGLSMPGQLPGTGAARPSTPGVPNSGLPGVRGSALPGQPKPGTGGQPNAPADTPVVATLVTDIKQTGKMIVATVEVKVDQKLVDQLVNQAQPYLARMLGEVEMASAKPNPYYLAEAARNYAAKTKQFPPGTIARPPAARRANRPWPPDQRVSGLAELLPYLGQEALYQRINKKESWRDPVNLPAASTLVPQFLSPDLPRGDWFVHFPGLNLDLAATSYVGIAGVGLDAAAYKAGDTAAAKKMGVFGYDRATPLSEIDDAANTILLIQAPPSPKSVWIAGGGSTVRGVPETKSVEPFVTQRGDGKRGAYMVMADGSVRWVTEQISDDVFKQLAAVKGQKTGDLDDVAPKVRKPVDLPELKSVPTIPTAPAATSAPTVSTKPEAPKPENAKPTPKAPNSPRTAAADKKTSNDLKELALAYHYFVDANGGKPPMNLDELSKFFAPDGKTLQAMKEGKYVFLYGATLQSMTQGTSNTVLAYEKDVPTRGGLVAMADGSVKTMTAQEFQAAPKAR